MVLLTKTFQNTLVPRLAIFTCDHQKLFFFKSSVCQKKIHWLITEHGNSKGREIIPHTVEVVPGRRDSNQRFNLYSLGGKELFK